MTEFLRCEDGALVLLADGLTIGRSPASDLVLDVPSVSRTHAVVRGVPGRWHVEDAGSRNGTHVNATPLPFGRPHPLRHEDVLRIGDVRLVVLSAAAVQDVDRTDSMAGPTVAEPRLLLSPFQHEVVRHLADPWCRGGEPASNAEIARRLGTPDAEDAVKAALRRVYAKAGLTERSGSAKRRELCRIARANGLV